MARDLRLLSYEQDLDEVTIDTAYDIVEFDGDVDPILVEKRKTLRVLVQSGWAIAFGVYLNAPAPLFPDALIGRPQIKRNRVEQSNEYRTTWTYMMALDASDSYDYTVHTRWPTSPATTPGFTALT